MSETREQLNTIIEQFRSKLEELKDLIDDAEDTLDEVDDPVLAFEVVLKVTTKASTWGDNHIDAEELKRHFNEYLSEIEETIRFGDPGDSIKVVSIKEQKSQNS